MASETGAGARVELSGRAEPGVLSGWLFGCNGQNAPAEPPRFLPLLPRLDRRNVQGRAACRFARTSTRPVRTGSLDRPPALYPSPLVLVAFDGRSARLRAVAPGLVTGSADPKSGAPGYALGSRNLQITAFGSAIGPAFRYGSQLGY